MMRRTSAVLGKTGRTAALLRRLDARLAFSSRIKHKVSNITALSQRALHQSKIRLRRNRIINGGVADAERMDALPNNQKDGGLGCGINLKVPHMMKEEVDQDTSGMVLEIEEEEIPERDQDVDLLGIKIGKDLEEVLDLDLL